MSNTGTKEKLVKLPAVRPPAEIRENTKARRAWLADQLAAINAQPNRRAKIIDTGSYQQISVYEVVQVEGRVRHRGACQCCGHWQVVDTDRVPLGSFTGATTLEAGAIVKHGYKRPGDGYLIGECPGAGFAPLNVQKLYTEQWSASADESLATWTQALADADAEVRFALDANSAAGEGKTMEPGAYQARPKYPRIRSQSEKHRTDAEKELIRLHEVDMAAWRVQFPMTARYELALSARNDVRNNHGQAQATAEHFRMLLASGIYGSPLRKEVVT